MVISNLAWLLPAWLGWLASEYIAMATAILMMVLSIAYHRTKNVTYEAIDTIAAVLFLISGPVILLQHAATLYEWLLAGVSFDIALVIYCIARTRQRRIDYIRWHSGWHVAGAVLCAIVYWCAFW